MILQKTICGKQCFISENGTANAFLIQAVDAHDLELLSRETEHIVKLSPQVHFTLAAFLIDDWNTELSPWDAPAVFGNESFGSGAAQTLSFVTDRLLPEIDSMYPSKDKKRFYLGGYSLSGLFALWAAYQTDKFSGIAAVSPSVWFPRWKDYIETHGILASQVYLSLGKKEEKTRNKLMAAVGDNIRLQHELLRKAENVERCALEWNEGNHFADTELRTAKGFAWLLNSQAAQPMVY